MLKLTPWPFPVATFRVLIRDAVVLAARGLAVFGSAAVASCIHAVTVRRRPAREPDAGRLLVGFQDDASLRWAIRPRRVARPRARGRRGVSSAPSSSGTPTRPSAPPIPPTRSTRPTARGRRRPRARRPAARHRAPRHDLGHARLGERRPEAEPAPTDARDLEAFSQALADRYSGRHAGYPAVRLFSAWNEPNLEQFLAPQFDDAGRSVAPGALRADRPRDLRRREAREPGGARRGRGDVAPRPRPSGPRHGPGQPLARRASRACSRSRSRGRVRRVGAAPVPAPTERRPRGPRAMAARRAREPRALRRVARPWFGRAETPLWVTEYGHETLPGEPLGHRARAAGAVRGGGSRARGRQNPRVRMFVWFILRDSPSTRGRAASSTRTARRSRRSRPSPRAPGALDGRNPCCPWTPHVARIPALELARYTTPAGEPVEVRLEGRAALLGPAAGRRLAGGARSTKSHGDGGRARDRCPRPLRRCDKLHFEDASIELN